MTYEELIEERDETSSLLDPGTLIQRFFMPECFAAGPGAGGERLARQQAAEFFRTAPAAPRVMTGRLAFFCRLVGYERLVVGFVGEDGAGLMAQVTGKVHELEPRANITWTLTGSQGDLGGGLLLFALGGRDARANRKALRLLKRKLDAVFGTAPVARTQIRPAGLCGAAYRVKDRPGLLAALTGAFNSLDINLTDVKSKAWVEFPDGMLTEGTSYCLLAFEMQLPVDGPAFQERIQAAVGALGLGGELFFGAAAVAAYHEAREKAGGSMFE